MLIHIARNGKIIAQLEEPLVREKLTAGEFHDSDYYWKEGMFTWQLLPLLFAKDEARMPFPRPATTAPGVWDRMIGRLSEGDALGKLWDLLATSDLPSGVVSPADLTALDEACGCKVRRRYSAEMLKWYRAYVDMYLADEIYSPDEVASLQRIALALGIDLQEATTAANTAVADFYASRMKLELAVDRPLAETAKKIDALATRVALAPEILALAREGVARTHIASLLQNFERGEPMSPDEVAGLTETAAILRYPVGPDTAEGRLMAACTQRWELLHEPLPVLSGVPILLQRDEVCHWAGPVEYLQMKKVVVRRSYGGAGFSIPIIRGISYRFGNYDVNRESENQMTKIDDGTVYITSKRIVFDGQLKNLTIPFTKVISVSCFKNAFGLDLASSGDPCFTMTDDPRPAYDILSRLCQG
jgi:hypothetical protein